MLFYFVFLNLIWYYYRIQSKEKNNVQEEIIMRKYLFLLGGYDLEMLEIKNILMKNTQDFLDKKLKWGAKLSHYKEDILVNKDRIIVGIELEKDIEVDFEYIEIDHHNKNVDKPSSIEQITELLHIELNRKQILIAKNDTGYIPAMTEYGASKEEVDEIRRLDREAQGVSNEDEKLAVKSLEENREEFGNLTVVKSLTSKFSTVTDRLYPTKNIFVYTDNEFTYYGENAKKLGKKYQETYGNKIYFGGSENGFFGAGENQLSKDEINTILKDVIENVGK